MPKININELLEIPQGIEISQDKAVFIIRGPKGEIKRKLDNPRVNIEIEKNKVKIFAENVSKREKAIANTYKAHLLNAFKGVQEPYVYKLKICSSHFPMNVSVSGDELIIKNFLGEKVPRRVKIKMGTKVTVEGNIIKVESSDKELAGQMAADIEQATKRPGFDKRIFQDGIYIIEKAGKKI